MSVERWANRLTGHEDVDPTQLLANPSNAKYHPPRQRDAVRGSLNQLGWLSSVIVNKRTGFVVDGHARIEEAISRGEPTVPVDYVDLMPEEERLALVVYDETARMAEYDAARLDELLHDLSTGDEGLRALLDDLARKNDIDLRRQGQTDPDDVPPVPAAADVYVQLGDLWQLGAHRVLCGNATNPDDVARLLDGATPTLLNTDPPYGVQLDPTWRDGIYNAMGPAEQPYMRRGVTGGGQARTHGGA